jgi:hypothetical protein
MRSLSEVKNTTLHLFFWRSFYHLLFIKRVQPCYEELFLTHKQAVENEINSSDTNNGY